MTDEIVTYDAILSQGLFDEILKSDRVGYDGADGKETDVAADLADGVTPNRLERRKQRTRTALIRAAQAFIASGKLNAPILEITQAADVGMGSFYNHFESKEELFEAAVAEVLDAHGALLDQLVADLDDPAEKFACSFRLTGRFFRRRPEESKVLLANGLSLMSSDRGLAPARCATSRMPLRRADSASTTHAWRYCRRRRTDGSWPTAARRTFAGRRARHRSGDRQCAAIVRASRKRGR